MKIRLPIAYLALLLIANTLAHQAVIRPDTADSHRVGAYTQIPLDQLKTLESQDQTISFAELQDFVRRQVISTGYFEGKEIGKVVKLEVQVVSGRNFRYTFENSQGEKFTATVFDQPWTNTRRLAHINLAVRDDL